MRDKWGFSIISLPLLILNDRLICGKITNLDIKQKKKMEKKEEFDIFLDFFA